MDQYSPTHFWYQSYNEDNNNISQSFIKMLTRLHLYKLHYCSISILQIKQIQRILAISIQYI